MFGKFFNNYYYGKSGKGDFRKEDLPETRMQLFRETLKTRFSALCRLNLLYVIVWLPTIILLSVMLLNYMGQEAQETTVKGCATYQDYEELMRANGQEPEMNQEAFDQNKLVYTLLEADYAKYVELFDEQGGEESQLSTEQEFYRWQGEMRNYLYKTPLLKNLALLALLIAITGPFTAGVSYVTRNWARDEHAFIWSDFKDAVKENWKIPLVLSLITGILPAAVYAGFDFYGDKSGESLIWMVPLILVGMIGFIWSFSITYMYPMTVTYDLKLKDVISNSVKLGIARLPMSIGIRLLHCVPTLLVMGIGILFRLNTMICAVILVGYYLVIGFALSRFITASYTNAVFDRFINSRIEGAKVNQGLKAEDDEDEDDEDEDEEDIKEETEG